MNRRRTPETPPRRQAKRANAKLSKAKERASTPARTAAPGLVVGLGASAGGLEAFQRFFRSMAADSGFAFVLVVHLDPRQKSALPELLGRATPMPVMAVTAPTVLQRDRVYVIAPGTTLGIHKGRLVPSPSNGSARAAIDGFFLSLAQAYGERAACVLLSGTGSDGTLGLKAVKEAGGLTIAQASGSAQYADMPRSAEATGLVDVVLPVEQIPAKLRAHARRLARFSDGPEADGLKRQARNYLANVCALLRAHTGRDFSQYKESTLLRRIQRRMQVLQLDKVTSYVERLRKDPAEAERLFQDLLIGVTHFFRDKEAFKALETKVIAKLFDNPIDDQIRVWVPGCSTGEEPYSIAMLLRERMQRLKVAPKIQIFATDIDQKALEIARAGLYPGGVARDVGAARLKRFFVPRGDGYQVIKDIREMCVFSAHDLIKDPPFSRLDLLSCRNVLIYMNSDLQNRVIPLFHFALRPGRFLFLGPSENVSQHAKSFSAVDARHRIFRAAGAVAPELPILPLRGVLEHDAAVRPPVAVKASQKALVGAIERALLATAMPAHVVVNDRFDLIYASPGTGKYLEIPAGGPNANLVNMARKGLRLELRAALTKAREAKRRVVQSNLAVAVNGGTQSMRLVVQPLAVNEDDGNFLLVVFQDVGDVAHVGEGGVAASAADDDSRMVQHLEGELRAMQERLQTTIEELETSNEELKSSNEEFQSMNEELQSANEELETSREELQSVNEELETVNGELHAKIESLDRANNDLKNLLGSTQIATIFLDRNARIKNFTPVAREIFHLIDSDLGRPITDMASRLAYGGLIADIGKVARSLTPIEKEVQHADQPTTFIMRILPYRTVDNVIDGVVLTFIDITERKRMEEDRARLGNLVAFSIDAIIGVSLDDLIFAWNAGAERMLGLTAKEAVGRRWTTLFPPDSVDELERLFERARQDKPTRQHDTLLLARDNRTVPVSITVSATKDVAGQVTGVSLVARDITERKEGEERLRMLLAELNHRVKNTLATVISIANQSLRDAGSLEAFGATFLGRIRALSKTHELLTGRNWGGAPLAEVIAAECAPHENRRGPANFDRSGPDVTLSPRAALSIALAVHELVTNATKHGALSRPDGRVAIEWSLIGAGPDQVLRIDWTERGGPSVTPPTRRGFGRALIEEGLAHELNARADFAFRPDGLTCRLEIPARGVVVEPDRSDT